MSNFSMDINSSLERAYRTVPILKPVVWSGVKELLDVSRNSLGTKQREPGYFGVSKRASSGKGIVNDLGITTLERSIQYLSSRLESYDSRRRYLAEAFNFKRAPHRGGCGQDKDNYSELGSGGLPKYLQTSYSNFLSYLIDESTTSIFQIYYSEVFDLFSTEWNERKSKILDGQKQDIVSGYCNDDSQSSARSEFGILLNHRKPHFETIQEQGIGSRRAKDSVNEYYYVLSEIIPNITVSDLASDKYVSIQRMCLSSFNSRIQLIQEMGSLLAPAEYKEEISSLWRLLTLLVGNSSKNNYTTRQMISNSIRALEVSAVDNVLYHNSNILLGNRYGSGAGSSVLISLKNFINFCRKLFISETTDQRNINYHANFPCQQVHYWFLAYWAFRIGSGQILWDMASKFSNIPQHFSLVCKCLAAILLSTSSSLLISQTSDDIVLGEENWIKQCVQFDFNKGLYSSREYRELNSMFYSKPSQDAEFREQAYYQVIFSIINASSQSLNVMKLLPNANMEDYIWYQLHIILKTNDDSESAKELNALYNKLKSQTDQFSHGEESSSRDLSIHCQEEVSPFLLTHTSRRGEVLGGSTKSSLIRSQASHLHERTAPSEGDNNDLSQNDKMVKEQTSLNMARLMCYTLHFGEAMRWIYCCHHELKSIQLQWVLYLAVAGLIPLWKKIESDHFGAFSSFSDQIEPEERVLSLYEVLEKSIKNFNIPFPFVAKLARLFPESMRTKILQNYVEFSLLHDIVEDDYTDSASFHTYIEQGKSFVKFDTYESMNTNEYSEICEEINSIIARLAKNRGHYITSILFFMEANLLEEVLDTILDCLRLPVCYSFTTLNTRQQLFFDKLQTIINKVSSDSSYLQQGLTVQTKLDEVRYLNEIVHAFVLIQKGFYRSAKEYIESKNFIPKSESGINSSNATFLPKIIEGYVVSLFELCRSNDNLGSSIPDDVHNAIFCNFHIINSLVNSLTSMYSIQASSAEKIHKLLKEMLILVSPDQLALSKHS
ncbi:putative low complexity [Cryptosporidium sp. chipmunk genotype I]|uniref:putative low complexity n=1 Tax=Cryptosporidium sp. chipmunk genotype I TaxID=1280935 RepID=UPI00351A6014|nr:putative low complexity [Cryptosporidium sp. chipmunk genotype I]